MLSLSSPAAAQSGLGDAAKGTGAGLGAIGVALGIDKLLAGSPRWVDVTSFDIAGMKLDMTPEQIRAAMVKNGFTPRKTDPVQAGYALSVRQEAAKRRQTSALGTDEEKVPMFTMAEGPQNEHIEVWYAATPDGARANQIKFQIPTSRMTSDAFLSSVQSRYGEATNPSRGSLLYCMKGERNCAYGNHTKPFLHATSSYTTQDIELRNGTEVSERRAAAFAAAVDAAAPANAKASF
ncbi:hypothetical protein [Sphingomonas sp. IW22]|uniref:hypothetical protein n=1 Tax=Sphingomonas sp. IW22 TaxID=3242489 RepID=UPI003522D3FB